MFSTMSMDALKTPFLTKIVWKSSGIQNAVSESLQPAIYLSSPVGGRKGVQGSLGDKTMSRLGEVLVGCGEICNTSIEGVESKFYPFIYAAIDTPRPSGPAPVRRSSQNRQIPTSATRPAVP